MAGPTEVMPVEHDGVRYEAVHWGKQRDLGQNGGFVAAIDVNTGDEIWIVRIYEIVYGDKSPQKYDRFITALELIEEGAALEVIDQTGAVHHLDLTTRAVTLISPGPVNGAAPNPARPEKVEPEEKPGFFKRLFGG